MLEKGWFRYRPRIALLFLSIEVDTLCLASNDGKEYWPSRVIEITKPKYNKAGKRLLRGPYHVEMYPNGKGRLWRDAIRLMHEETRYNDDGDLVHEGFKDVQVSYFTFTRSLALD